MLYTEKRAGDFLKKNGFLVLDRVFVCKREDLEKMDYPIAMKASGSRIVHKAQLGGVFVGINDVGEANSAYEKIMKIPGASEVLVQRMIKGRDFILGIKKTPEFGHVLVFGEGGTGVEEKKDVSFRMVPVNKKDVLEMISDTKIGKTLSEEERKFISSNLLKLSVLAERFPKISELDINPIISGYVVDSRIVFD